MGQDGADRRGARTAQPRSGGTRDPPHGDRMREDRRSDRRETRTHGRSMMRCIPRSRTTVIAQGPQRRRCARRTHRTVRDQRHARVVRPSGRACSGTSCAAMTRCFSTASCRARGSRARSAAIPVTSSDRWWSCWTGAERRSHSRSECSTSADGAPLSPRPPCGSDDRAVGCPGSGRARARRVPSGRCECTRTTRVVDPPAHAQSSMVKPVTMGWPPPLPGGRARACSHGGALSARSPRLSAADVRRTLRDAPQGCGRGVTDRSAREVLRGPFASLPAIGHHEGAQQ